MQYFKEISTGLKFLFIVMILYVVVAFIKVGYAESAFIKALQEFVGILPILFFVFLASFIANYYIKTETIKKHLGHDSGLKGWLYAVLGAMVMVGPPYILFPLLGDLKRQGMRNSLLSVFLNNRSVQPIFMPVMAHYFGLPFTVIIFILTFLFSIPSALITEAILKEE